MLTPDNIQTLKAWVAASTNPAIVSARTRGALMHTTDEDDS